VSQTAPHQALYRRWRAQTFGQMVGQEAVVETLRNAVRTGRVAHAILFVGPRGTGKTSLARILAKALNCTDLRDGDPCDACASCVAIREGRAMDLVEIDAASNRGIDAIRELRERINYAPADLRRKIYILDEAHQITKDAWNALLKSLEEPPEFVVFMFASTHPQDFPPAILSRLQRFDVRRLTTSEIEGKLRRILEAEGREADMSAMHLIARLAAGGMRDAESMLDQLLASSGDRLDEDRVRDLLGLADADTVEAFVGALATSDVVAGARILDTLEERGRDLRAFLDQVIEVIRGAIVGAAAAGGDADAAGLRHGAVQLVPVARRLAGIDPNRAGVGGLRLQLELVLFPLADGGAGGAPRRPASMSSPPASEPLVAAARTSSGSAAARPAKSAANSPAETGMGAQVRARERQRPPDPNPLVSQPLPAEPAGSASDPAPPALDLAPPVGLTVPVGGDLAVLRDRWPEIVTRISKHPPTKPLISVCRPIAVEDAIVTLGFPEDQGFLRDVAERRRSVLEEGIGAVLGRPVSVRCVATNLDLVAPLPADAEAAFVLAEARRIFGGDGPPADPVD
jgi:DNA polymerase-3 subunit gamma/tau